MQIVLLTDKFVVVIWNVNPVTVSVSEEVCTLQSQLYCILLNQCVLEVESIS